MTFFLACSGEEPQCQRDEDCPAGQICSQARCIPGGGACRPGETKPCYTGPSDTRGRGVCRDGTQTCDDTGKWGQCVGEILPSQEVCDKKDNDCDGQIDEGPAISQEVCDGIDNDCDGQIDEDPKTSKALERDCYTGPKNTLGRGPCKGGRQTCQNGQWGKCIGQVLPKEEICNNKIDDDCDGKVDNPDFIGKPCTDLKKQGHCQKGTFQCGPNGIKYCKSNTTPKPEVCNGIDEDCDGYIDNAKTGDPEPLGKPCPYTGPKNTEGRGPCRAGKKYCKNGKFETVCTGEILPTREVCNGKDDDCDGIIDNAKTGDPSPLTKPCYDGPPATRNVGFCRDGIKKCIGGKWSDSCQNQRLPRPASCDNKMDYDCDGKPDTPRFIGEPCIDYRRKGRCRFGIYSCQGILRLCKPIFFAAVELCNGEDDDCDGKIDNIPRTDKPLYRTCYTGPEKTRNRGNCSTGKEYCDNGRWSGHCAGEILPSPERCNRIDDDCDGQVDEDGICDPCTNGSTRPCYNGPARTRGQGQCTDGKEVCVNGRWSGKCVGSILPKEEICNNLDDNCDGFVDNIPGSRSPLVKPCYTGPSGTLGKGLCAKGVQRCVNGNWERDCRGQILPQPELCNRRDDDCDGLIDEGYVCFKKKNRQPGEICLDDPNALEYLRCGPGSVCLQAWERDSTRYCYKTCNTNADCKAPPGETAECIILSKQIRICVIRRGERESCDLTKGIFCKTPAFCDQNLKRCRLEGETDPLYKCGGKTGRYCGKGYYCTKLTPLAPTGYCLKRCKYSKECKSGFCYYPTPQVGVCLPAGSKGLDQVCGGDTADRIDTAKHCQKKLFCTRFSPLSPLGVCLPTVAKCTPNACKKGRYCLSLGGIGVCARRCEKTKCPQGQQCTQILPGVKVCTPPPPSGNVPFGGTCSAEKFCQKGLICLTATTKDKQGVCAKIPCLSDAECPKNIPGARCQNIGNLNVKGCILPCQKDSDCPANLGCHQKFKFCLP